MDTPLRQSSRVMAADSARMREVHRAVVRLRGGAPVVLAGAESWLLVAAETADEAGLDQAAQLGFADPLLLVGRGRARGLHAEPWAGDISAFALPSALVTPDQLRRLADPVLDQLFSASPVPIATPSDAEPAIGLLKLARLLPAALVARLSPAALAQAVELDLIRVSAASIASYPEAAATHLVRIAEASVPLDFAPYSRIVAFRVPDIGTEHLAILVGRPEIDAPELPPPLARIHSECFTGDLIGSLRCDCGAQLRGAIRRMGDEGRGVLLYLAQEGRGIGLVNKLRAYTLQDRGLDTFDANHALGWAADERNFLVAATMLKQLGIPRVRLLTNNPDKIAALTACGIEVSARESHSFAPNGINDDYLATKATRFGHLFDLS